MTESLNWIYQELQPRLGRTHQLCHNSRVYSAFISENFSEKGKPGESLGRKRTGL